MDPEKNGVVLLFVWVYDGFNPFYFYGEALPAIQPK